MSKVSCIIPAYNEGPRIANVLRAIADHPLIEEVIVIDDCSIDDTAAVVETFTSVRLIRHEHNKGKTRAVYTGIEHASEEHVLLLDSDLLNLTSAHVTALIEPVLNAEADISISLRNYPIWQKIGLDPLSGERVLAKKIFTENKEALLALPKFGLESFMNKIIIANKHRVKIVQWAEVVSPYKHKKDGFLKGATGDIRMIRDIFKTISPLEAVRHIIHLRRLRVR